MAGASKGLGPAINKRMKEKLSFAPPALKARLVNIDPHQLEDFACSREVFSNLLVWQLLRVPVTIQAVGCEVDGTFAHDYHDVLLPDGSVFEALSGYNLELIKQ